MKIPRMGRRKFSYKNKPHGRNELIKEYLWLAYLGTLAPGEPPDPSMLRDRKQISSHIQVLKGFLRDHPAYHQLFPPKTDPKNDFEDSFKNDPTLRAISEGRLPAHHHDEYDHGNRLILSNHHPMKPSAFWLLMTPFAVPSERNGLPKTEQDLRHDGLVLHRYSGLSPTSRPRGTLESIPHWRQRFPYLAHLVATDNLNCEVIHMDVSLDLMKTHAPDKSELLTRLEMVLPGRTLARCAWQSVTSLIKPQELHGDLYKDPILNGTAFPMYVLGYNSTETRIKVAIPAETWAYTFTQLMNLHFELELEKKRNPIETSSTAYSQNNNNSNIDDDNSGPSIRNYVDQIAMYQELQSSSGEGMPFIRRAILIWTFRKSRSGESNDTTWRYVDPAPPRHMCMSPPQTHTHDHLGSSSISEYNTTTTTNHNAWPNCDLQTSHNGLLDPFVQGLATPPHTAGLQSPFDAPDAATQQVYAYPSDAGFDMSMTVSEGLSFASHGTVADSEATLVDLHAEERQLDNLFSVHANAGLGGALGEYDDGDGVVVGGNWHLQGAGEVFDTDAGWDGYAGQGWETGAADGKESHEGKGELVWPDTGAAGAAGQMEKLNTGWPGTNGTDTDEEKSHEAHASWEQHDEMEENTLDTSLRDTGKTEGHDGLPWSNVVLSSSPNKQNGAVNNYIEGSIESKLLPWIEQATAEEEAQAQAQTREAFQEVAVVSAGATGIVDIEALERAVEATENAKQENGLGYHGADLNGQHDAEAQGWVLIDHDNIGDSAEAVVGGFDYEHLDESVSVKS
ncbi:hypothetical protein ACMFMG_010810 [Clarireedia jacksonii]